jgi:hypothetical protein
MEILPDAARWRSEFDKIAELYRTEGVLAAMGKFGALVEEGGPKYSEEMQQAEPSLADQEMFARMGANFELFIAHEIQQNGRYVPDFDVLQQASTRIERLDIPVTYLPGAHGGWGSDPQEFAERLHEALQGA